MPQHPTTLKKADLVRVALDLNLGPSRAALDVHTRGGFQPPWRCPDG